MKMQFGNVYVAVKPLKGLNGNTFSPGAICHYVRDNMILGYDDNKTYSQIDNDQDLENAFCLYEESPVNKRYNEVYERAVIAFVQGILSNPRWPECASGGFIKTEVIGNAMSYADYMIDELKKRNGL